MYVIKKEYLVSGVNVWRKNGFITLKIFLLL